MIAQLILLRIYRLCIYLENRILIWQTKQLPKDAQRLILKRLESEHQAGREFLEGINKLYPGVWKDRQ